jgi:hypothetical protein
MSRTDSFWNERCYKCKKGGEVICCDKCRNVVHLKCSTLDKVPVEKWFCDFCQPRVHSPVLKPLKVLELFKGTGSLSSYCSKYPSKYVVTSLDISPEFEATETCDIKMWNYGKYPIHHFDIIFSSPPCEQYSMLKTRGERKIEEANEIVLCTLEIIDYFKPKVWFIENPATGLLKEQSFMQGLPYYDVDYCKYSDFGYRKRTRLWSNLKGFKPMKCNRDCGFIVDNKHVNTFGSSSTISLYEKIRIPQMLLHKLMWMSYRNITGKINMSFKLSQHREANALLPRLGKPQQHVSSTQPHDLQLDGMNQTELLQQNEESMPFI